MSKEEQFEHIENKIKEAIQNNQPAFDEEAWVKMEALLDKKEKKPRPFFWIWFLFPLLLAGAGALYFFTNNKKTNNKSAENISHILNEKSIEPTLEKTGLVKEKTVVENIPPLSAQKNTVQPSSNSGLAKEIKNEERALSEKKYEQFKKTTSGNKLNRQAKINNVKRVTTASRTATGISNAEIAQYNDEEKISNTGVENAKLKTLESVLPNGAAIAQKNIVNNNQVSDVKNNNDSALVTARNDRKPVVDIITPVKKSKDISALKKSSSFYFLGSLGADIGSVKLFSFSNSSLGVKYGVGVGYQLNKKLSVQTGFYAGKKKYTAGPNDYHPKEHSYWSYVTITKVNAECMIYEIPVTLRYNLLQKSSLTYYTTIGLSSYLMKEEDYNYYYIRYNVPAEKYYTYTGNKHLFSTLSFSGGIEKKISNVLSLQLEPSVSLPLSGVGDGEVKLFSTAIMLGIKYFPFKK